MQEKIYNFSVIIPIYNVEEYLQETIDSVIEQTIGFKENIQLILVNDGSTDGSEKICLKYRDKFPKNIVYVSQENAGVSAARNKGLEFASGKYVNFLDADDIWDKDVFEKVYDFFGKNQDIIDVVACRQKLFEAKEGYHRLDYKFEETQIIDIKEKYDYIQLSTASAFIKLEVMKKYKYDTRIEYSEDAVLIAQILMEKSKYGILAEAIYNYRKRMKSKSALQIRENKKSWYNETIDYGCNLLIEKSKEKYGEVIPYIQYQIMYDIQWRVKFDISKYLDNEEQKQYINKIKKILQYIDDKIIMEQKSLWTEYKILTLSLKYGKDITKELEYKDGKLYFKDIKIYKFPGKIAISIKKIKLHRRSVILIGRIKYFLPKEDYKLYINIDDENHLIKKYRIFKTEPSITGKLNYYREFRIKIPIKTKKMKIRFVIDYKGNKNNLCQNFQKKDEPEDTIVMNKLGVSLEGEKEKIIVKKRKNIFK